MPKKQNNTPLESSKTVWPSWQTEQPYAVLLLGIMTMLFLAMATRVLLDVSALRYVGLAPQTPDTITVVGEGKVTGVPDIATISFGVLSTGPRVADVQADNSKKVNNITAKMKSLGITAADMQTTQYTINPHYDYSDNKSVLTGYDVQQMLTLKIRDLAKISEIVGVVGELGANQVGGLTFTIDDPEVLRITARQRAISNARAKAEALAKAAGVRLVRVVSFNESFGDTPGPINYLSKDALGMGGGPATPDLQAGSLDVTSNISLSYEIR